MDPIQLGTQCLYLTSSGPVESRFRLHVFDGLEQALRSWQPSTRLSPVWPVVRYGDYTFEPLTSSTLISGKALFIGPIAADVALDQVILPHVKARQIKNACLTLGMYSVVALLTPRANLEPVFSECAVLGVNWECWTLEKGKIVDTTSSVRETRRAWVNDLAALAAQKDQWTHPLYSAMEEYLPLMASALARSESAHPTFTVQLMQSIKVVKNAIANSSSSAFFKQSQVTHINAALSRLSSQMFSGVSPILATECHYWIHSLLGTGTANLGLQNLAEFIELRMGEFRLPDRLEAFKKMTSPALPNLSELASNDPQATKNYLDAVPFTPGPEKIIPLISYFSGRDGFKSNTTIISVPLSTISNANATPWTLQTLTHEVSHVVVEAILSVVLPRHDDDQALIRALKLAKDRSLALNWHESIVGHLVKAFISLNSSTNLNGSMKLEADASYLRHLITQHIRDVAEIIVHVFDFMYFYGSDPESYVNGIWTSWSAIPEISSRVPDYVVRTVCAVCSAELTREEPSEHAIQTVKGLLDRIKSSATYANDAVAYIDSANLDLEQQIIARLPFIQFVRAFMYSPALAAALQADSLSSKRASRTGGYEIRRAELSGGKIANPLTYIASFTREAMPNPSESLILWHMLAHGLAKSMSTGGD